jgi:hypothetical protein
MAHTSPNHMMMNVFNTAQLTEMLYSFYTNLVP